MNALAEAGLLKATINTDSTIYSLTPKGWGLLTPWNPWKREDVAPGGTRVGRDHQLHTA